MSKEKLLQVLCLFAVAALALPVLGQESTLRVTESGVGTGVVNRVLQGEGNRFHVGDAVWFWTRVEGGEEGDRIHHVWIQDGEEKLSLGLSIGGPHWRTWSHKTMHPGSEGEWVVEARDEKETVLARATFTCVTKTE